MPSSAQWETYLKWSRLYDSDIIHLNVAGTSIVVLSSQEAVSDLLEKRSNIYSDRARMPMVMELMGWGFNFPFESCGEHWRKLRPMYQQDMNAGVVEKYRPQVKLAVHKLLGHLIRDSGHTDVMNRMRHMTGDLIMSAAYGITVLSENDPYVNLAEDAVRTVAYAFAPGQFLVDSIPALMYLPEWFPGAGFKQFAKEARKLSQAMLESPFAEAKRLIAAGGATGSFTSSFLAEIQESGNGEESEQLVKEAAGTMYIAGTGTMASVLGTFVLAMLAHPAAQRKAQAEIDSVIGSERLPDFSDEQALPYVSAILNEVLRWKPVTPFALPHFVKVEDEYRGYRIPAQSIVIGSVWAIFRDESIYPDPDEFKPERWLLSDGQLNPAMRIPEELYGFGRRICAGRYLANMTLWITIASILATFDISKAIDSDGSPIEPSYEYVSTVLLEPMDFSCSVTPRSKAAETLVEESVYAPVS